MKCLLDVDAVKAFRKALNALSRIGDELWLDPTARGLALRAVNAAHSAYGCFLFSPLFFLHYSLDSVSQQDGDATIRCKLSMKCFLPLFRCVTSLERSVERCHILLSGPRTDRLTVQFFCRHGITKTHSLCFQDSEALQAVFSSHLCPNVLKAPARLLTDVAMQFPAWQEEVTLLATPDRVALRSHSEEGGRDHTRATFTQMLLEPDEFLQAQVPVESQVTFCLKELRGFLSFAESHCLPVWLHLSTAGQPVCFSVDHLLLEASVVLATLVQSGSGMPAAPPPAHRQHPLPSCSQTGEKSAPWQVLVNGPLVCRCAGGDVADPPVAATPAASRGRQPAAAGVMEEVASSQGSPAQLLLQPHHRLLPPHDQSCSGPSPTICSLLFRAASSQLTDRQGLNASLPVLVCDSDEGGAEEEEEED
ncbi:cell cycle checkpoint control protein RAD9B [Nelusetta ayraudi]|uniref:cell cycle checkpoint control protein RAD9B n=1 Tax=Nelusetta ayraudi TaxID=303726 RepID=UPI003F6E923A